MNDTRNQEVMWVELSIEDVLRQLAFVEVIPLSEIERLASEYRERRRSSRLTIHTKSVSVAYREKL